MSDFDRDRLREITEKIQVGDADEGAEALGELLEHARSSGGGARQAVRQELTTMRLEQENANALAKFGKRWSSVSEDPVLAEAGMHVLRDHIVDDLKAAGVTEEMIAPARGDTGRLVQAHTMARAQGLKVRNAEKLLEDTGRTLAGRFKIVPKGRSTQEIVRDARTARGFANWVDDDVSSVRPTSSPAEDVRRARARQHLEAARKARGFDSYDSY